MMHGDASLWNLSHRRWRDELAPGDTLAPLELLPGPPSRSITGARLKGMLPLGHPASAS